MFKNLLLLCFLFCPLIVFAGSSFRLSDGDLVLKDMSKIEVLDKLGTPLLKDVQSLGIDTGGNIKPGQKVETWSYNLKGSIGGEYLVSITFEGDRVVDITSVQKKN
ncbi:DUF2845 domain-containing protein [uncultured Pseudoalteromonas sp.]|jgi:hypothetical protein|uniref:DUF2845 domain-containing protein n=1 Tax=uncultured Pseudoalteromonas sp. TaxID=114053 RepID=UPI0025F30BB1|nr:DUF2845 domain-containing protein [uncultured Pseudoalteromonas sp.]|tara:strand:+ start:1758 stop:2075 length:318 start_codon:yes stop_codon:yes gene_type:complete